MTSPERASRKITGGFVMVPAALLRDVSDEGLSGNAILTFASLLSFADYDTGEAYPGQDAIGARARLSVASVKRALTELVKAGLVTIERQGANKPNRYWVEFTYTSRPVDSSQGTTGKLTVSPGDSSPRATNDIQENDNQLTTGVPTAPSADGAEVIDRLIAFWAAETPGRHRSGPTDNRRRVIRSRLRKWSAREIAEAIRVAARDDFSNGKNDRNRPFNDLTTTMANDEKVEAWRGAPPGEPMVTRGGPAPPDGYSQAAKRRAADVDATIGGLDEMIRRAEQNGGNL